MATFITGDTGRGSGPHLDFRIFDVTAGDYINPTDFTDVLMVGGKPLTEQFTMSSGFGQRQAPVPGASTYHLGLDYRTPSGTQVDVKGGTLISTYDGGVGAGIMSQYGIMRNGKPYDVLLLHGSKENPITGSGFRTDFDYSTIGATPPPPSITPTPARKEAKEKAAAFIPGALQKYPGIVARYEGKEVGSAPATMKSSEPKFDIRSRDSDARGGYDPRFDVHPKKR